MISAEEKLGLALKRGYFRSVDLFSGCGGMTLGFHRAGFKCVAAVEIDDEARRTHIVNFSALAGADGYRAFKDIKSTSPMEAVEHLKTDSNDQEDIIDIVIGGPPCQAFSRLGRARLWELSGEKYAHQNDDRATMYQYFLQYVEKLKPLVFVMENVREIGKFVGRNIAEEIAATAEDLNYDVKYTLLNAVWFGVPQLRERAIIMGIHKDLHKSPVFPYIQNKYNLPVGYSTARAGSGRVAFLPPFDHYVDHLEYVSNPKNAVSVQEAFADLPPIFEHLDGRTGKGLPRLSSSTGSYTRAATGYAREMRMWPDFKADKVEFTGHIIRYTPRDYEIFRRMPHGGMYPDAHRTAMQIFAERIATFEKTTRRKLKEGDPDWEEIYKKTVPPYPITKYPNKFRKMWPEHPARTLPAHLGKDSYSHIHFDSEQARCISLREAARLQSFPDGFVFPGTMNTSLKQIGNAVPPLLAYAIASEIQKTLSGNKTGEFR